MRRAVHSLPQGALMLVVGVGLIFPLQENEAQTRRVLAPSKVQKVLIYSGKARVYRKIELQLGAQPMEFGVADLPDRAEPDTVQVTCATADVMRVSTALTREHLPRQVKAKELLTQLEKIGDQLQAVADKIGVLHDELQLLNGLQLYTPPTTKERPRGEEGIFAGTWRQILSWVSRRTKDLRAKLTTLTRDKRRLQRTLHPLRVKARTLNLNAASQPVLRVTATLKGRPGRHRVVVSYLVSGLQWRPTYDLSYNHKKRQVEATTYALLQQTTGEDWANARLEFSTGRPTHLMAVPELPTWTLGRDNEFTPTPRRRHDPPPPVWTPSPPQISQPPIIGMLQAALRQKAYGLKKRGQAPRDRLREVEGKLDQLDSLMDDAVGESVPARARRPATKRPTPARMEPPPSPSPSVSYHSAPAAAEFDSSSLSGSRVRSSARRTVPRQSLPWTDTGYRPPALDPDSPAAAAKGYLYTLYAPGSHTIKASGQRYRVPLLKSRFSVQPVIQVAPAMSASAFLTAMIKNSTGKPILRGHANIFAGPMFSGRTWINTALPGQSIQLPLGVDDNVKVVRHLHQKTVSQGVVFKDDITEHRVEIEVANHHRRSIQVKVEDQVPLTRPGEKKVKIQAFSSADFSRPRKQDGKVIWSGRIKASSVKKLSFTYQILRPKDWELTQ